MRRLVLLLLAFPLLSGCGVHTVDTGFRGIKTSFGQVEGAPLVEGLYFVNPFTTSIHPMDVRIQRCLARSGYHDRSILAQGKVCAMHDVSNLSLGGESSLKSGTSTPFQRSCASFHQICFRSGSQGLPSKSHDARL